MSDHKPITEEELKDWEADVARGLSATPKRYRRLISEVRRLREALGTYGMPTFWDGDQVWDPPIPEPGWVLARKTLGWGPPAEPCDNPSCDGVKDDKTFGDSHRCFKDGRWLDDGSEI